MTIRNLIDALEKIDYGERKEIEVYIPPNHNSMRLPLEKVSLERDLSTGDAVLVLKTHFEE